MESRKNFRDPITGEEFFIPHFRTSYNTDGSVKKRVDKYGKELVNPATGNALEHISQLVGGETIEFNVGKFSMMSKEDKKKVIKKRSQDHAKKHTNEYKQHVERHGQ